MQILWKNNKKFLDDDSHNQHFVSVDFDHHTDCSCRLIIATGSEDKYLNEDLSLEQVNTLLNVLKKAKRGLIFRRKLDQLTRTAYSSFEIANAVMNSFLEQNPEVSLNFEVIERTSATFIQWKKR